MLEGYEQEEYGELSKEQMEGALSRLRTSFVKFDALASALSPEVEETQSEEETLEQESESEDEEWSE
jgi:hypothetical protein